MCLILFAYKRHPKYKLIVAANRDEFYVRPTEQAKFWEDHPSILAGKDKEAGGTWMGVAKSGKVGMLTNYRDPHNIISSAPSRGHLVSDFLSGPENAMEYLKSIRERAKEYNGFNLICGSADELNYYGNYQQEIQPIKPGIYGLSNALLDTSWPKVVRGKHSLEKASQAEQIDVELLFDILSDDSKANELELPKTGVSLEQEKMLSPIFIKSPGYGTRCSTVLLVDSKDQVYFTERTYDLLQFTHRTVHHQFGV